MLVLSRQRDEEIYVDFANMSDAELLALRTAEPIKVQVVDIRGDKVRLGIKAPDAVSVNRRELYEKVRKQNQEASQAAAQKFTTETPPLPPLPPPEKDGDK